METEVGTIVRLKPNGYGFVARAYGGSDLFFHRSALRRPADFNNLRNGDAVTFTAVDTPRGPNAVDVERLT